MATARTLLELTAAGQPVVCPVIHANDPAHALEQARIADSAGAAAVFVICHDGTADDVARCAELVAARTDLCVGVNALDLRSSDALGRFATDWVGAIWTDNAGVEHAPNPALASAVAAARDTGWRGAVLGGTSFKYQRQPDDIAAAAQRCAQVCDIVVTSGPATGEAADTTKVCQIVDAAGDTPVALASGVDHTNLGRYWHEGVSVFLVASSISSTWDRLDPAATASLVAAAAALG